MSSTMTALRELSLTAFVCALLACSGGSGEGTDDSDSRQEDAGLRTKDGDLLPAGLQIQVSTVETDYASFGGPDFRIQLGLTNQTDSSLDVLHSNFYLALDGASDVIPRSSSSCDLTMAPGNTRSCALEFSVEVGMSIASLNYDDGTVVGGATINQHVQPVCQLAPDFGGEPCAACLRSECDFDLDRLIDEECSASCTACTAGPGYCECLEQSCTPACRNLIRNLDICALDRCAGQCG